MKYLLFLTMLFVACTKSEIEPQPKPYTPTSHTDTLFSTWAGWTDDTLGWGNDTAIHLNPPYYWATGMDNDTMIKYNITPATITNVTIWVKNQQYTNWVQLPATNYFTSGDSVVWSHNYSNIWIGYRYGHTVKIPTPVYIKEAITFKK